MPAGVEGKRRQGEGIDGQRESILAGDSPERVSDGGQAES